MKTIIVGSQKGGSGKTSLVRCLAVQAEQAGDGPAWIIDSDQQGTLSEWHQKRQGERPQRGEVELGRKTPDEITRTLRAALDRLERQQGAEWCFIDTAPADTDENGAIYGVADLVLIPVRPSPDDLRAVRATLARIKAAGVPFLFIITQAKLNAKLTAQTIAALSKHGQVTQAVMADRTPYAEAITSGHTAPELWPRSLAAHEIALLWDEVKAFFAENINSTNHEMRIANG
jgi:chromosome partitioning protein